jgi:hypothetical protein
MGNRKEWTNDVGQILESKAGKLYIKIEKDMDLKAGDTLTMDNHMDGLAESLEKEKINQETYDRLVKNTSFVKYKLQLPPSD